MALNQQISCLHAAQRSPVPPRSHFSWNNYEVTVFFFFFPPLRPEKPHFSWQHLCKKLCVKKTVSAPVYILPISGLGGARELASVSLLLRAGSLPHSPAHPARLTLAILFIAVSLACSCAGPIRSIAAPFEGRGGSSSPLQPRTPPSSATSRSPFDVPEWIWVQMCFYQFMCFSPRRCLATAERWGRGLHFAVHCLYSDELGLKFKKI